MGLFSFVTDAGSKLGGAVYDMLNEDEDINKPVTISPERLNQLRKKSIETSIGEQLGEKSSAIEVAVNDSGVTLTGSVADQPTCEKATLIAGNSQGIAEVDCQLVVDQKEPEAVFYTVKAGDSLSKIAKSHYQDAGKYTLIFEANKPMLTDPSKIFPGQSLRIPPLA